MLFDVLVKKIDCDDLNVLEEEFLDKREHPNKKLTFPHDYFNSIDDYTKPVHNLKKEDFFSK